MKVITSLLLLLALSHKSNSLPYENYDYNEGDWEGASPATAEGDIPEDHTPASKVNPPGIIPAAGRSGMKVIKGDVFLPMIKDKNEQGMKVIKGDVLLPVSEDNSEPDYPEEEAEGKSGASGPFPDSGMCPPPDLPDRYLCPSDDCTPVLFIDNYGCRACRCKNVPVGNNSFGRPIIDAIEDAVEKGSMYGHMWTGMPQMPQMPMYPQMPHYPHHAYGMSRVPYGKHMPMQYHRSMPYMPQGPRSMPYMPQGPRSMPYMPQGPMYTRTYSPQMPHGYPDMTRISGYPPRMYGYKK